MIDAPEGSKKIPDFQLEDNFTQLMKQQKFSVDTQLDLDIKDPLSSGLLCEGIYHFGYKK